jgi:hypothetical protein
MCDAKASQIVMKIHGNIDEKISQNQIYYVEVVCAMKIPRKLRSKVHRYSDGFGKIVKKIPTNFC